MLTVQIHQCQASNRKTMRQALHELIIGGEHDCCRRGNPQHPRCDAPREPLISFFIPNGFCSIPRTIILCAIVHITLSLYLQPCLDHILHISFSDENFFLKMAFQTQFIYNCCGRNLFCITNSTRTFKSKCHQANLNPTSKSAVDS